MDNREEFEKEFRNKLSSELHIPATMLIKLNADTYQNLLVQNAWQVWKAATKAAEQCIAELQKEVEHLTRELTAMNEWRPIESAPKDGSMMWLALADDDERSNAFEDTEGLVRTIGFNSLNDTGEDLWEMAGWDWCHDNFTKGTGTPLFWRPIDWFNLPPQQSKKPSSTAHLDQLLQQERDRVLEEAACRNKAAGEAEKNEESELAALLSTKHQEVDDLAMLVRVLVRTLKKNKVDSKLQDRAVDYLRRHDLLGSPLRSTGR